MKLIGTSGVDSKYMNGYDGNMFESNISMADTFDLSEKIVVYPGDCLKMLADCPDETFQLVVTSPPYNIGKEYEKKLKKR